MTNITPYKALPPERYLTISTSNYQATQTMQQLAHRLSHTTTRILIEQILVRTFIMSGYQDVPSDEDTISLIADQIIHQYPQLEVGELCIALKEGLTGRYGPNYNRIAIDTVGHWISKYYTITWPIIEARGVNRYLSAQKAETEPTEPPVQMPGWFKDQMAALAKRVKRHTHTPPEPAPYRYISIEDYCHRHDIPAAAFIKAHRDKWEAAFMRDNAITEITADQAQVVWWAGVKKFLNEINNGK